MFFCFILQKLLQACYVNLTLKGLNTEKKKKKN